MVTNSSRCSNSDGNIHHWWQYPFIKQLLCARLCAKCFLYSIWLISIIFLWSRHFIPILWMRNLKLRECKYPGQDLTTGKTQTPDFCLRLIFFLRKRTPQFMGPCRVQICFVIGSLRKHLQSMCMLGSILNSGKMVSNRASYLLTSFHS